MIANLLCQPLAADGPVEIAQYLLTLLLVWLAVRARRCGDTGTYLLLGTSAPPRGSILLVIADLLEMGTDVVYLQRDMRSRHVNSALASNLRERDSARIEVVVEFERAM